MAPNWHKGRQRAHHVLPVRAYVIDNLSEPEILHLLQRDDHIHLPNLLEEMEEVDIECLECRRPS